MSTPDHDSETDHDHERVHEAVDERVARRDDWARRRRKDIPNDQRLMVVTCMDERIPVADALGLTLGDAHIFRNAGGKVTDDVIRSAALTTNFFDTDEIVVVTHTDCGMMSASDEAVVSGLQAQAGDLGGVDLDPALPELTIGGAGIDEWLKMTDDIDAACTEQVEFLRSHPLVPDDVTVTGYVYEVESGELRRPGERVAAEINTREA
ncbi:beta-class carbonic anhydrase [Halorientalis pallida]|uniref:Carbonic anhydrase n=1 Tax=Halorientalis pallida TaxID=2479928 RepID=A0A498KUU9_9EURY|nr:carbonic anhydrase [Halorientalis pallida]RXK47289.1 carbonic anhydrase [Halorientalis pallida]